MNGFESLIIFLLTLPPEVSPEQNLPAGKLSSASGFQASWENAEPAPLGPRTSDHHQCLDAENVIMMIVDIL